MMEPVLLKLHSVKDIDKLATYREHGGYRALEQAAAMRPEEIVRLADASGLRGRGGAAFPAGFKWKAVLEQERTPHYFICNIAEGEPGSFKDRELLKNPHQVLEATAIAARACGADKAFLYLRGIFLEEETRLKRALREAEEQRLLGTSGRLPVELFIHRGEDSYIAGEETALIESLEGKPAIPRTKPPRPYESGLWDYPTAVSNVETICNIIGIVLHGPDRYRECGTPDSPGTKLFCLSGRISRPGVYELPLGVPLLTLLNDCGGGPLPGHRLRVVFPGGPSTPLLAVEKNPNLDFESLCAAGTSLGTGGMIVIDDSVDIEQLAIDTAAFFARESCKVCPPCSYGTSECHKLFLEMKVQLARDRSVLKIRENCEMMKVRGSCAHNRSAAFSMLSFLEGFPEVFSS
jgi:NADH-quinone oxidoreductase subunit F